MERDNKYLIELNDEAAEVVQIWRLRENMADLESPVISVHTARTILLWSEVKLAYEYSYKDENWMRYSEAPKTNVHIQSVGQILILGDYRAFGEVWKKKLEGISRFKLLLKFN